MKRRKKMTEAIVTIKFTESELQLINEALDIVIKNYHNAPPIRTLLKQLHDIKDWIDEEKRKASIDKKEVSEEEYTKEIC